MFFKLKRKPKRNQVSKPVYRPYLVAYIGYYGECLDTIVYASSMYEAKDMAEKQIGPHREIIAAAPYLDFSILAD